MSGHVHDFIGVGAGPFNLGLAALTAPVTELDGVFLDEGAGFDWHPGMMLDSAHLQVPFLADLVTMADPTSRYSFLNYLKESDRLYRFYIRENFYPLRAEFNKYCQWVAAQLPNVHFGERVTGVQYRNGVYEVRSIHTGNADDGGTADSAERPGPASNGSSGTETVRYARRLVLGTGTQPHVPPSCRSILNAGGLVLHTADYLTRKEELQRQSSITIVGSGQSAAELYRDLLQDIDVYGYELNWVTRSGRFFPLEYTKLTLEMTSPEYVDYFHALPADVRGAVNESQKNLYKGIDEDLINEIYDLLYIKSLDSPPRTRLLTHSSLESARYDPLTATHALDLRHGEQDRSFSLETGAVVLATGYTYHEPAFLAGIADRIRRDDDGRFDVGRDYSIGVQPGELYVQNAELHTHGFATPDLGMAAYRNACIIREMLGWEYYPVERTIAFQQFGAPDGLPEQHELAGAVAEVPQ